MLYLIATPIGNLGDLTFRAVETLREVDYILCEDTRHSQILLNYYSIQKPLVSYHKFNEAEREAKLLQDLQEGKKVALISDGGTPALCDPGQRLVASCRSQGIPVTALPGACAFVTALILSGFKVERIQFVGFLPKKEGELRRLLIDLLHYEGTTACYESPHRLIDTLHLLNAMAPSRLCCVARELTKHYEETCLGTPMELLQHWENGPPKGEIVLLISESELEQNWLGLSPQEHVELLQSQYQLTRSEAIKVAAELRGQSKRELYKQFHQSEPQE